MTVRNDVIREKLNSKTFRSRAVVVLILSLFVITAVFWWLKLVGITMAGEAFCGMEEHSHSEECLAEGCSKTEHTHIEICYSDPASDVETGSDWEEMLSGVEQSGVLGTDLLAVARSQIGYTESTYNFVIGEDGVRRGYTRYGAWHGNPYGDWSSMFACFCLYYADITEELAPYNSGADAMRLAWKSEGLYRSGGAYSPETGDLVFLDRDGNGSADAVGILSETERNQIVAIEGDLENAVGCATYLLTDSRIIGYGSLDEVVRKTAAAGDIAYADYVVGLIEDLPSYEEVEAKLASLEEDEDAYEAYFKEIAVQAKSAYIFWEDLPRYITALVDNVSRLEDLNWMWMYSSYITVGETGTYTVSQVNCFAWPGEITAIYGMTPETMLKGYDWANNIGEGSFYFRFQEWYAYVIETNDQTGALYLDRIYPPAGGSYDGDKKDVKALTAEGFVVMVHKNQYNAKVKVGDSVRTGSSAHGGSTFYQSQCYRTESEGGVGYVVFGENAKISDTDTTQYLNVVQNVPDTASLIEINLHNYGVSADGSTNINTKYYETKGTSNPFPGFQRPAVDDAYYSSNFAFGDVVIADFHLTTFAITGSSSSPTGINTLVSGYAAKRPLSGQMWTSLASNGYPAMISGANLDYLFQEGDYVFAANDKNVTGLFQYDPTTEMYYYDSRKNHAQFDAETDTFILYEETITPNFIMYPFGNFMPFNSIVTQSTPVLQVGSSNYCNYNYFKRTAASAMALYNTTRLEEYKRLSDFMEGFITSMNNNYGTDNWNAWSVLDRYNVVNANSSDTSKGTLDDLVKANGNYDDLFNIDFDERCDFFFGMDIHYDFFQPKDGLVGVNDDQAMVFEFAGDDDVWVYIDEYLFLDLSGIHSHVGGKIDFRKGQVLYYELQDFTGAVSSTPYKTVTFREILRTAMYNNGVKDEATLTALVDSRLETVYVDGVAYETFKDYSEHTFDFYYMERGSGSSICSINFNLPILEQNRIEIEKDVEGKTSAMLGDPDYLFMIVDADDFSSLVAEGAEYRVYDSETKELLATKQVEAGGIIRVKDGQTAIVGNIPENAGNYFIRELFELSAYEQYSKASITGTYTDTVLREELITITVGGKSYKALMGGYSNAGNGNTHFQATNYLDSGQIGSLQISKRQIDYSADAPVKEFVFDLKFDGEDVAAGTPYKLISADGTVENKTIVTAGKLIFPSDKSVLFENMLAGTTVSLKEADTSSAGYVVGYVSDSASDFAEDAETGALIGTVVSGTAHKIVVVNDAEGVKLTVNGTKTLLYPDSGTYRYTFDLREISLDTATGAYTVIPGGMHLQSTVTLDANSTSGALSFTLNFPSSGTDKTKTHYFRIAEENATAANGYDTNVYILAVTFDADGNAVGSLYKNGEGEALQSFAFENRVVRELTVSKAVEGIVNTTSTFTFTVKATDGTNPLTGVYPCAGAVDEIVFDENGEATFTLKHGETVTIQGLPYGTVWTVTESPSAGYYTQNAVNGGDRSHGGEANGELTANASVVFYNVGGAELPSTGGFMRDLFPMAGMSLMALALVLACVWRFKRARCA